MARIHSTMLMQLGSRAPEFSLPSALGPIVSRSDFVGKPLLVAFWCNHCPFVQHIRQAVLELYRDYQPRGLAMVAINSNDAARVPADDVAAMQAEVAAHGYPFAYLVDRSQQVAHSFRAACTPDFFLFDANHKLVYRGAFDDSTPSNGKPISGAALRSAVDATLLRQPLLVEQQPSLGCSIKWREPAVAKGAPDA